MPTEAFTLAPQLISAASGLLGAAIGGGATLLANIMNTNAANSRSAREFDERKKHERTDRKLLKGEELVGLLSGASDWYTPSMDTALTPGFSGMIKWPTEPERTDALVLAYFPELELKMAGLKQLCLKMHLQTLDMNKTKLVPQTFQDTHAVFLRASSELQIAVLKSMRSVE